MTTQKRYLDYLQQVETILQETTIASTDCEILKNQIKNIELIVPVVGGFSAGKSTIINDFLGEKLLATNLTPETALATELHYSSSNYIEAIDDKGDITRYEISQTDQIKQNASQYQYLKFYINNEKIKQIQPLVLVDMPGFNAPLEQHNKAILNYLARGVHFIVAISAEDGTLQKNILREIQNILTFSKGLSVCLTKTNLKPSSDIEAIHQEISSLLQDYFDYNQKIYLLGKDASSEMQNMLTSISPEVLVKKLFLEDLKQNQFNLVSEINLQISTLKSSQEELKEAQEALHKGVEILRKQKDEEIAKIQRKYAMQNFENILTSIQNQLLSNQENLSSLILSNPETFSSEVNSIVKSVLIREIPSKFNQINQNILDNIKLDLSHLQNLSIDTQWIDALGQHIQILLSSLQEKSYNKDGTDLLSKLTPFIISPIAKIISKWKSNPAKIVKPLLTIATIILPKIISFSKTNYEKQKALETFVNSVIPTIKTEIRQSLEETFSVYAKESVELIYAGFEKQIQSKQEEINKAQKEQNENIDKIQDNINQLNQAKYDLQALAEKTLYQTQGE